jgi:hypothetical protein
MRQARQAKPPLQLQVAHPPDWLPDAHASADLGTSIVPVLMGFVGLVGEQFMSPGLVTCLSDCQKIMT